MKSVRLVLFAAIILSGYTNAAPVRLDFSGVSYGGVGAGAEVENGTEATFSFVVDWEALGYNTYFDGTVVDLNDSSTSDYFYSDLISETPLSSYIETYSGTDDQVSERNYGFTAWGDCCSQGEYSMLVAGSQINPLELYRGGYDSFIVGATWSYRERFVSESGQNSQLQGVIKLNSITPINAVPLPASAYFLITGVLAFAGLRYRAKKVISNS